MEGTTPMMRAIFFTRFHPEKGARVLHQVPEGSIVPPADLIANLPDPLFDFRSISDFVIPKQEFCDRLVTVCVNHYRVIGYPVCIEGEGRYYRNEFIFNLAIVLDDDADTSAHASVVRKLARMFRNLEEQSGFLSSEEDDDLWDAMSDHSDYDEVNLGLRGRRGGMLDGAARGDGAGEVAAVMPEKGQKVYALCEMILEDLNNYCECMIPIDEANTINLKLFPARPPPAPVRAWHVPLLTIQTSLLSLSATSDLTLTRILPFINGIRSVAQIARLADTDLSLARKAVQHLLYYGCILLLDIFQFSAVYAPTPAISDFVEDVEAQDEAVRYVSVGQYQQVTAADDSPGQSLLTGPSSALSTSSGTRPTRNDPLSSTPKKSPLGISPSTASGRSASKHLPPSPSRHQLISSTAPTTPHPSPTSAGTSSRWAWHPHSTSLTRSRIVQLYTSLRQGMPLRNWCIENETLLSGVDVRRFITFGVIKGFLYRVHRWTYVNLAGVKAPGGAGLNAENGSGGVNGGGGGSAGLDEGDANAERIARWDAQVQSGANSVAGDRDRDTMLNQNHTGGANMTGQGQGLELSRARLAEASRDLPLAKYLDGLHCFDEMCTELMMSEREVLGTMKRAYGDVMVIAR